MKQLAWLLRIVRPEDWASVAGVTLLFFFLSLLTYAFIGGIAILAFLSLAVAGLSLFQLAIYRRLQTAVEENYRQAESLTSLSSVLRPNQPLPRMRGWAISPDFANLLIDLIRDKRPKFVLEIGSGLSSLVAGYCLKRNGSGTMLTLEHDEKFANLTLDNLRTHGLGNTVRVVHAPLRRIEIAGQGWIWYETEALKHCPSIDLLIVDGPPGTTQRLARYPALPLLFEHLSAFADVVLDDAARPDEKQIIDMWLKSYPSFARRDFQFEKGATLLSRIR